MFNTSFAFQHKYTLQQRMDESSRIIAKHPDRIPVICEKASNHLPNIEKCKYLVPYELSIGQFLHIIRGKIKVKPEEALFLFIGGNIMSSQYTMGKLYADYKNMDGFLYVQYSKENTFGI